VATITAFLLSSIDAISNEQQGQRNVNDLGPNLPVSFDLRQPDWGIGEVSGFMASRLQTFACSLFFYSTIIKRLGSD
jgi:hypothetical protein